MSGAVSAGLYMPPEWAPHRRTWMAWPVAGYVLAGSGGADGARRAWADVANAVAAFEPVTMLVPAREREAARALLVPAVELAEADLCDCWMRDAGPTFVLDRDGALAAVDWTFNGWGGRTLPLAAKDALLAREVARRAGACRVVSKLVNEGGGLHVDGEGTVLLTETVQLNPNRNPNWDREEVEAEVHARLGTRTAIWLARGLAADYGEFGTDGHIDTLACFARPGLLLVHRQPDPAHPDHSVCQENIARLAAATDGAGRRIEVIALDAPAGRAAAGEPHPLSYVNFALVNGGVIACVFDDPADAAALEVLAHAFPDRRIVPVAATRLFEAGGGIHCITQQEPLAGRRAAP